LPSLGARSAYKWASGCIVVTSTLPNRRRTNYDIWRPRVRPSQCAGQKAHLHEAGLCERTHSTMDQKPPMLRNNPKAVVNILPHGLTHAVERLSMGFEWENPLDAQTMSKLSALGAQIASVLPRKFEISTSEVRASVHGIAAETPLSEDDGELFAVLFDDNEEQDAPFDIKHAEVIIKNDGFSFSVHARYDGWEKTRAQALKLCEVFFDEISKHAKLESVEFRVSNVFRLDEFKLNLDELLNEKCDSLPSRIFDADGLWHIDEGYFERQVDSESKKLLVNLNVSKVSVDDGMLLYVKTMHQLSDEQQFEYPITLSSLFDKFEYLHDINKSLLASVLNEKISRLLGLIDNSGGAI